LNNFFNFLICSERSGSNLITKIMDAHSKYCGPSPVHLLRSIAPNLTAIYNAGDDGNWSKFVNTVHGLLANKVGYWASSLDKGELLDINPKKFENLIEYIYKKECAINNKKYVFIKENHTYNLVPYILQKWPDSKFLFFVRDPRDVALSWINAIALRGGTIRAAKTWQKDQMNGINLLKTLGKNTIKLLSYEALLSNPEDEIRELCVFFNCDYEKSMTEFYKNKSTVNNSNKAVEWKNISQKLITDNFNKYKNGLNENQIKYIEFICNKEMDFLNYQKEFTLIDDYAFLEIEKHLLAIEPINKSSYNTMVSNEEKDKRIILKEIHDEIKSQTKNYYSNLNKLKL
jgi:hypothetical protein